MTKCDDLETQVYAIGIEVLGAVSVRCEMRPDVHALDGGEVSYVPTLYVDRSAVFDAVRRGLVKIRDGE